jgi:hypothetical protein
MSARDLRSAARNRARDDDEGQEAYNGVNGNASINGVNGVNSHAAVNGINGHAAVNVINGHAAVNGVNGYAIVNGSVDGNESLDGNPPASETSISTLEYRRNLRHFVTIQRETLNILLRLRSQGAKNEQDLLVAGERLQRIEGNMYVLAREMKKVNPIIQNRTDHITHLINATINCMIVFAAACLLAISVLLPNYRMQYAALALIATVFFIFINRPQQ